MKTTLYIDYDSLHPELLTVRVNVKGDWVDFGAMQEKSEEWLHARVAIAQAIGIGMLWPAGEVVLVAAVSRNGDGRAVLGAPMMGLEKMGAGMVLGNVATALMQAVEPPTVTDRKPE